MGSHIYAQTLHLQEGFFCAVCEEVFCSSCHTEICMCVCIYIYVIQCYLLSQPCPVAQNGNHLLLPPRCAAKAQQLDKSIRTHIVLADRILSV